MKTPTVKLGRPRADAPPAELCRKVNLTLPESAVERLRILGQGNVSAGVRALLQRRPASG